jgi:type II secretory pathway component GspD/PulD (secretin)
VRCAIAAAGLLGLGAQAPAVSAPTRGPPAAQVRGNDELAHLLDLCAKKLALDIHYEPEQFTGAIAPPLRDGLSDEDLWALANRALVSRGLTTVQMQGEAALTVVALPLASSLARLETTGLTEAKAGFVKILHELRFTSPDNVLPTIEQVLSGHGGLAVVVGLTHSILLSGLRPDLDQVLQLLELLDVAPGETVTEIPLHYVEPDTLVSSVELLTNAVTSVHGLQLRGRLLASRAGQAVLLIAPLEEQTLWRDLIARVDQRREVRTVTYTPVGLQLADASRLVEEAARGVEVGGLGEDWNLVADELTGSLVLTATASQHKKVGELLERRAACAILDNQPVRVFSIRNRSSLELANLLNRLVGTGFLTLAQSASSDPLSVSEPPSALPIVPVPDVALPPPLLPVALTREARGRLLLSADEATNTLFATGDALLIDKVAELIETLDVMASQVMLEVLILNLSDSDAVDLGVEIRGLKDKGTIVSLSSLFGLGVPDPGGTAALPSLSGFTGVVLNPGDFSVLVNALQVLNKGRALNIPKVLVNSNQKANLASVLQTPFLSTNATTVIATTTFGGTQDAGTTIEVRPQIAEGDHLVLEYSIVLSTFVGAASDPSLPPPRQQNNLHSVATIPDGYTVALGGLETMSETELTKRVPYLASLPLLGALFRSRSTVTTHSRFYVFIRASILRSANFQRLEFLSDLDMHRADLEPGWPEVEPALIR